MFSWTTGSRTTHGRAVRDWMPSYTTREHGFHMKKANWGKILKIVSCPSTGGNLSHTRRHGFHDNQNGSYDRTTQSILQATRAERIYNDKHSTRLGLQSNGIPTSSVTHKPWAIRVEVYHWGQQPLHINFDLCFKKHSCKHSRSSCTTKRATGFYCVGIKPHCHLYCRHGQLSSAATGKGKDMVGDDDVPVTILPKHPLEGFTILGSPLEWGTIETYPS